MILDPIGSASRQIYSPSSNCSRLQPLMTHPFDLRSISWLATCYNRCIMACSHNKDAVIFMTFDNGYKKGANWCIICDNIYGRRQRVFSNVLRTPGMYLIVVFIHVISWSRLGATYLLLLTYISIKFYIL